MELALPVIRELKRRATDLEAQLTEPVAIVSMACRLPGGVGTPEEFWELLSSGGDAIGGFPSRWDGWDVYDPDPEAVGKSYAREGGFLRDVEDFDAGFFGIPPREARGMDPQQRLILETSWEALERAGIRSEALENSDTGVYLGTMSGDYGSLGHGLGDQDGYVNTGRASSVLSGRVSYALGLRGPAVTVDTACSSSLVALHLAVSALRQGECDVALAGGVTVMSTPSVFVEFSRLRGMAADGRCKSFSADADGAGWSEGCGVLVLKRLSAARAAGDRVLAVIRGSAVNQDGRSQGLTAPNGPAQQRVIEEALSRARLSPSDVDAVEAHGTGTPLGDPVEAGALAAVFGPGRSAERPVWLGSAKSNIGHAQAAAGVIGVIKMVLALQHETLPLSLHAERPSEHVEWEGSGLRLLDEARAWPREESRPRRAGVSSFGLSGTNAHLVLEESPAGEAAVTVADEVVAGGVFPVVVSGRDAGVVRAQARRWARWWRDHPEVPLERVASTALWHRSWFDSRGAVLATTREEAIERLEALAEGTDALGVIAPAETPGGIALQDAGSGGVWVFPGQGSQWEGMGRALFEQSPVFAEAVRACEAALLPWTGWSVVEVLTGRRALSGVEEVQPALFAMSLGLAAWWESMGVTPQAVIGHSQGEVAAAVVAGILTVEQGARIVAARSRAVAACRGRGGMAVVERGLEWVTERLAGTGLSVAAVNTPASTVISGDSDALDSFLADVQAEGVFARRVQVDYASHSAHMDPLLPALAEELADLQPQAGRIPMYSTVYGRVVQGGEVGADYWCANLRRPVRFDLAGQAATADGHHTWTEISPHPVMAMVLDEITRQHGGTTVATAHRDQADTTDVLSSWTRAGLAYADQWPWERAVPRTPVEAALPTYAFDRERYWLPTPGTIPADPSAWGADGLDHPWLTLSTPRADDDGLILSGSIDATRPGQRWLTEHKVFDTVLLPGTAILDMVLTAAERVGANGIDTLTLTTPLVLPDSGALRVQVAVTGIDGNGRRQVTVHTHPGPETHPDTPWTTHATAHLTHHTPAHAPDPVDWTAIEQAERVPLDGFYDRFRERGIDYGPAFQGLVELSRSDDTAFAVIRLPEAEAESAQAGDFAVHPALLDAALHAVAVLDDDTAGVSLPFEWTGVELYATGATELRVRIQRDPASSRARLWMADAHGDPVAYVDALVLRPATEQRLRRRTGSHLHRLDFQPPRTMRETPAETWVLGGSGELAHVIGGRPVVDVDELRARLDAGDRPPARLVLDSTTPAPGGLADAVRVATATALHVMQDLLAESRLEGTELVWVTREAVPAEPGEGVDGLVHAPLWGLVRAARAEYPQRSLRLVDTGPAAEDAAALARAVSVTDEPEIAVRGGEIRVARLVAVEPEQEDVPEGTPASEGTALITGGTGELGRELARHLVRTRGVRRLVLTSRQGEGAPGAADLAAELAGAGADSVRIVACDVADREALAGLIGSIDDLDSVWHLAGVLDDGLLPDQNTQRLERVLAPKLDAALHLHELTREHELSEFVMFSSLAGVLGSAGQSTYAAGNAFLDAFAAWRVHAGLPARSLSWGLWEQGGTGLTAHLGRAELTRIRRMGVEPLSVDEGLRTLDAALATDAREHLVPVRLGPASAHRDQDEVPALLRGLVRTRLRRANTGETPSGLRGRLAVLSPDQRRESLTLLVRSAAASVLGLPGEGAVSAQQVLRDLGLDSLMAVELRRRVSRETEVPLPATLAFDHPTPAAMAEYLLERMDLSPAVLPAKAVARAADGDDDPVAIVSMACRLPGGVGTPEEFWELLSSGGDAIGGFPSRWDGWDVYDPDPEAVGKSYAREGGFLRDVEDFDAGFFGIPPREARGMDPQQRLVLEASWEALERAGIRPETMEGSNTGVYLGAMGSDYDRFRNQDLNALDAYGSMGSAGSVLSGRVSYALGLRGPAVTVDTACSSSLVALHLAVSALRQGECDVALAGGVTVMSTPSVFVEFSRLRGMAADGRCKSFSADADGAGWSEGCGVLVLKRLSAARAAGDRVLAVIRGSAVNQDGRSQGLTAPNGPAQQRVIEEALSRARLSPSDVDAVEAHGTGTPLGDPVEAGALAAVFGPGRSAERPVWLGSAKSNIGHAQAAAGVIGVIKMVLALAHEQLPATLHVEEPSRHIEWEESGLALLGQARAWPREGSRPRRAGVSSFGLSGTNAHLVLEESPAGEAVTEQTVAEGVFPVVVSGRDAGVVRAQARRWAKWWRNHPEVSLDRVASTALWHRSWFDSRGAVLATTREEAIDRLEALAEGTDTAGVITPVETLGAEVLAEGPGGVWVFPGQGSQWEGMGRALFEQSPVFAEAVRACEAALLPWTGWSVVEVLTGRRALSGVEEVQPALFAMSLGLAAWWESMGVTPQAVIGHSQGEVAAAVVAGILTVEQGARIVAARSRAVAACRGRGGMAVVERGLEWVTERLTGTGLSVAAVNTPTSTVISGDSDALDAFLTRLRAENVFARRVQVDYASHSAHMDPLLPALAEELAGLQPRAGRIPMYSTVYGRVVQGGEVGADYWCANLRRPVRFDLAGQAATADGHHTWTEISPHPVMAMVLDEITRQHGGTTVATAHRDQADTTDVLSAWVRAGLARGNGWPWERAVPRTPVEAALPTYAFDRERYWLPTPGTPADPSAWGADGLDHPWLTLSTPRADDDGLILTGSIDATRPGQRWLSEHKVFDTVLLPGTAILDMVLTAAERVGATAVDTLTLTTPLVLPDTGALRVQVAVTGTDGNGRRQVTVHTHPGPETHPDTPWTTHATAQLTHHTPAHAPDPVDWTAIEQAERVPLNGFYDRFRERGIDYGPAFQGLEDLWRQDNELHAVLRLPESLRTDGFGIHPALLDAAFHTILAAEEAGQRAERVLLPFEWSDARLYATGASVVRVRVRLDEKHEQAELCVTEENGNPVAAASLRLREATAGSLRATRQPDLYRLEWQECPAPAAAPTDTAITAGPLAAALELPTPDTGTGPAPSRIVVDATQPSGTPEEFTAAALVRARDLLADPRAAGTELVWVTRRAVSVDEDETVDLASAPLWGLLRAARAEGHPVRLVDVDGDADPDAVRAALTVAEPELVVRGEDIRAPRLVRLTPGDTAPAEGGAVSAADPGATGHASGTVLITGGTGALGRQVARHLVGAWGVRKLVLASRRGDAADGSAELIAGLTAAGADSVRVVACDVTSRDQVAALVESVPDLSGVWHLAGVLDDGLLTDQTPDRLERVWAPKARAAWWLHELTADRPLTSFVVFSSAAGVLGSAGQSVYAAANAFADAVVLERHRRGLPALSLSWGLWEQDGTGLTAHLGRAELARMRRQGVTALTGAQALDALDAALTSRRAHLVPLRIDLSGAEDDRSPLLRGRTRMRRLADTRTDGAGTGWSALPEQRRLPALTDLVRREAAEALGSSGEVHPDTRFTELGLDSLMAVELRRRLSAETGLSLPATAVFDHPTPAGLARYLDGRLGDRGDDTGRARVRRVRRRDVHPATEGQRRLWFLEQMRPGTAEYNVTMPVRVAEPLDRAAFASAVEFVVRRHEALRTGLESRDGELVQVVHEEFGTPLRFEEAAGPEELAARIRDEAETPFDLSGPVLLRCLVLTGADEQVVCFTLHHAIIDASSLVMVLHELFAAYDAFRAGLVPDSGSEPPVHLGDYAGWERDAIARGAFEAGLGFFRSELAGAPRLELPRGTPDSGAGKIGFALPDALRGELETLASDAGVTLYTVLAGAFAALLSRYSDQRDFSIGTVWSGRTLSGTAEIVGFLANTLPLRCDLSADPTVPELLAAMRSRVLGVMEHQNVPLSEVVRAVGAERNGEENPLFRAVFNYGLGAEPDDGAWQPFAGSFTGNVAGTAKFELTMSLAPAAEGLRGELEFRSHVLDHESAQRMVANFETLLHSFLRDGALPVSRLSLLHPREEGWFRQHGDSPTPDTAALPPARPELCEPAAGADQVWQTVLSAWSQVLELEPDEVDPDIGFFDLGGTSLTAVRVHELIRTGLDREFPLSTLFRHSTVRQLTTFLRGGATPAAGAAPAPAPEGADEEAVAIVGVALRLPGASDAEEFWANLRGGVESIRRFTDQEMLDAGVPAHAVEDPAFVQAKGYVGDADLFDAEFFGYSRAEAENMDPQHRLFLETAWQGLENAGIVHDAHPGRIGVFAGAGFGGYNTGTVRGDEISELHEFYRNLLGNKSDFVSTRVAHKLNLRGPALTVQTACSTGLVLAHLARQSLLRGESDVAIVGASALTFPLEYGYPHQEGFVFSPDGSCRAFDADRQGTVVGNGVVAVVMRRLSDAVEAGDRIYAVVRGSAINNDGSDKVGFTAPSVSGQATVITDALADAGLSSADIGYVEAHGTATAMGDLIEIQALQEVFSSDREEPCAVGSVKSNIGHVDVAAGLAGLVKAALCVYHGELVPTVNFDHVDPELGLDPAVLRISDDTRAWRGIRRAGVSSFGIGGTNAHVVIEQPPQPAVRPDPVPAAAPVVLSGRTPQALRDQARQWAHWLTEHPDTTLTDLAWTTTRHRRHFEHRAAVLAHDLDEMVRGLTALGDGQADDAVCTGVAGEHGKVAFVFAGHGSQWPGMARRLLTESPAFADTVARCDEALRPWTGWSVQELLENPDTSGLSLDDVEVTQPALFTVALGLAQVWRSVGLEPEAVVGHSQGEVPAAVVAGALTLEEGARIVAVRSQAFGRIESGSGGMALLGLPLTEVEELLADHDGALSVAAVNTPGSVAVAGAADAVDDLLAKLADRDVFSRRIKADRAGHCSLVDPMLPEVEAALDGLRPRPTTVPMYSTVTGAPIGGDTLDARYWCRNLREPVRMDLALDALRADGFGVFTEVSPHPLLAVPLTAFTADGGGVVLGSLRRDHGGLAQIVRGLGELHVHGHPVDWTRVIDGPRRLVDVPGYAFQRQSYWIDGGARPRQERQAPPPADLATRLAALPEPARARTVLEAVQDAVRGVLGLGEPLPVDERFQGRGMDSMMALQLRNRLSEVTGAPLPSTLAFEHPTPRAIVDHLLTDVFRELPPPGPSTEDAERREVHPATEGQRRLWFLERMRPGSAQYNAVLRFEVDSPLCPETFRSALRVVMERHEALRTGLESRDGELVQVVHPDFTVPLRHERATGADELDRMLHAEERVPFELDAETLFRCLLVDSGRTWTMCFTMHHAITDGWSMSLLLKELHEAYQALAGQSTPRLAEVRYHLGDYARWEKQSLEEGAFERSLAYFASELDGAQRLELPERAAAEDEQGDAVRFTVPAELRAALDELAARHSVTKYTVYVSAFAVLLARYTDQYDFSLGTIWSARELPQVAKTFGFLANTLPLRCDLTRAVSFEDVIAATHARVRGVFENQSVPLSEVVRIAGGDRTGEENPLFRAVFNYSGTAFPTVGTGEAAWRLPTTGSVSGNVRGASKFELGLTLSVDGDVLRGELEFQAHVLDQDSARRMTADFETLLASLAAEPARPVREAGPLRGVERRLLAGHGGHVAARPAGETAYEPIPAQAARARKLAAPPAPRPELCEPAAGADQVWQTVLSAWSQVLELEPDEVDPDIGFFDLGGTSLTAVRVHELVCAGLDREFPLSTLFRHSTVRQLTTFLRGGATPAAGAAPAPAPAPEGADEEAVAIVGVALRLPGASDAEEFWANLRGGVESIRRFTDRELLDAGVPAHVLEEPGFVPAKGYIEDADRFDAEFFRCSPSEAQNMDPQHRLFLETAWQGLENAGIVPGTHPGRIGVFGGVGFGGYDQGDPEGTTEAFRAAIGNMNDFLTTRLAHKLNLRGPALTVQTACSTGLVLAHLARQSLLRGESDVAIVGASALTFPLEQGYQHEEGFVASPDGHCRPFDADAAGTVLANGVVAVVMRRLSDAVEAGDRIYAVVRGSAINNDGSDKVGFTAPSVNGQATVITDALADAGLSSADIGYVEAHGTATAMGDPIEIQALQEVFTPDRDEPCAVGSVKSNIGHVDVAAGLAGLVKAALCVYHGELVPTVNFQRVNPELGLDPAALRISDDTRTWRGTRRAGVSSFGIGGTNAHLVIEQPPQPAVRPAPVPAAAPVVLSGRTPQALRDQARQWAHWLTEHPDTTLTDLAWTTTRHRRHFAERASVAGPDLPTVVEGLTALAQDRPDASVTLATARPGKVVFVFPGQGSQWPGMARRLLTESPAFADTVARCDEALRPWTGWSVLGLLQDEDRIAWDRLDIAQPVLFTMYLALAAAMRDLGLEAQAVVGHSQGEIPAAVVAGSLTLEEGARIVAERSRTLAALSSDGEMATVQLPVSEVEAALAPHGNAVSVAVVNTPGSAVVSGDRAVVEKLLHAWDDQDVMCGKLNAACASHSSHMDALLPGLRDRLAPLNPRPSRIPLYSTVLGRRAAGEELDADYWCRNLREPVRLDLAQQELLADGYTVFVEVSPHPVLAMPLADGGAEQDAVVLAAMERDQGGLDRLQRTLGALHAHGVEIDWPAAVPHGRMVDLPGYAFQRQRHWKAPARRRTTDQRFWDAVGADEADSLAELLGASGQHRDSVADLLPLLRRWHESRDGHAGSAGRPHGDETTGTPQDSGLAERLAGMDRDTQLATVLELVRAEAAATLGTTGVPAGQPLQQLGMDSLMAVGLRARIARRSGLRLGTDVLFRQGGCAGIAQHVVDELTGRQPAAEAAPDPLIRVLKPARHPKARILCMSGMGGTTTGHVPLIPYLPEDVELLGVRVPGREGRSGEAPVSDVNVLVDRVVADLSDRLDVPVVLYGHSQGAYTAWEIAHRLGSRVGGPDLSLVVACAPSPFSETPEALKRFQKVSTLWDTAAPATLVELFRGVLPDDILDNEEVFGTYVENLRADVGMWNRHQLALRGDRRGPLDIPVTAVSGTADPVLPEGTTAGWSTLTSGEFVIRSIEGSHSAPLENPKAMALELTAAAMSHAVTSHA
ncbi:hypothetical protein AMK33_30180 [Streptomyces sp. CB02400]|nr:hypothetical protein AMK33_30180 [Streptomyces sp. CB02400]